MKNSDVEALGKLALLVGGLFVCIDISRKQECFTGR